MSTVPLESLFTVDMAAVGVLQDSSDYTAVTNATQSASDVCITQQHLSTHTTLPALQCALQLKLGLLFSVRPLCMLSFSVLRSKKFIVPCLGSVSCYLSRWRSSKCCCVRTTVLWQGQRARLAFQLVRVQSSSK